MPPLTLAEIGERLDRIAQDTEERWLHEHVEAGGAEVHGWLMTERAHDELTDLRMAIDRDLLRHVDE